MNTQPIWVLLYFATWPKYTPIPGCPVSFQEFDPTKFLIRNASEKISHHLIQGTKTSLAWYKDKNIQNLRQRRIPCNCYVDGKGSGFQAAQRSVSSGRVSLLPSAPSPRSSRRCFHPQPPRGQLWLWLPWVWLNINVPFIFTSATQTSVSLIPQPQTTTPGSPSQKMEAWPWLLRILCMPFCQVYGEDSADERNMLSQQPCIWSSLLAGPCPCRLRPTS